MFLFFFLLFFFLFVCLFVFHMSLVMFRFWTATVLTFFKKNGLKLLQDKALEIIPKYGRTEARSWLGLRKE